MRASVDVQVACGGEGVPPARELVRWARAALAEAPPDSELTVRVVGDDEGGRLNREYRAGNGPTNVLSFPFEAPAGVPLSLLGDVVICAPVALKEAAAQGKPPAAHWAHLVVHGALHLLGHDHQTDADAQAMERYEREILASLGYPDPYAKTEPE